MKKNSIISLILLFLSAILFVASEPSFICRDGLSFCAFFCYVPFFLLCEHISVKKSILWGAFYGFISYLLLCPWISHFGTVAILFVCILFAFYNSILFFLLVWSKKNFPKKFSNLFWIFRCLLVLSVEFLRTHGIFAFSYGIIGYSQWKNPAFLNFSSLFGVFGVSLVILLFNSIVVKMIFEKEFRANLKIFAISLSLLAGIFVFWGFSLFFQKKNPSESISLALIQNASSASSRSISEFQKDAQLLKKLTDSALEKNPSCELVLWAETAIVPDIIYNFENPIDKKRYELSKNLVEYFESKNCSFLIGNNHRDSDGTHNSALFFSAETKKIDFYNKNHLVPFTEFWPSFLDYKIFDGIKDSLECEFFAHGSGEKIFGIKNLKFATPICFEDSFSPLLRKMKKKGADFFVNISDDAWSHSLAAQNMHLSMSAFRSAEFSSPMLRSTIDGKTCILDSKGKVISELESGIDGFLCSKIEIQKGTKTFYSLIGDFPMILVSFFVFVVLLILFAQFVKLKKYGRR